jgi:hypothetical protein
MHTAIQIQLHQRGKKYRVPSEQEIRTTLYKKGSSTHRTHPNCMSKIQVH